MFRERTAAVFLVLFTVAVPTFLTTIPQKRQVIAGSVRTDRGPAPGAIVRHQGQARFVRCDGAGKFHLPATAIPGRITASLEGYRIGWTSNRNGTADILLRPLPERDHPDYAWIEPGPDRERPLQCANCHREIHAEWAGGGHARSASSSRFMGLFAGVDSSGKEQTRWNLMKENPDGAGVCASCHAPTLTSTSFDYDIRKAEGVAARGVHCDYCHKVAEVLPDPSGLRFGKDGLLLLRPEGEDALFFGPLDDAVRPGESFAYAPFFKESTFCASCHEGRVFGNHAYGTYTEWLESPAARQGVQCQNCHMAPTGHMTNVAPGKGGIERDPKALGSHALQGGTPAMLRKSIRLDVAGKSGDNQVVLRTTLTAGNVGHRVPTGFPDRHLVTVVEGFDGSGNPAVLLEGSILPAWAGKEAGRPGVVHARRFFQGKESSPLPFWLPGLDMEDTRLHPDRPETRTYRYSGNVVRVRVRLYYRSFWPEVARSRGWDCEGFVVAEKEWRR